MHFSLLQGNGSISCSKLFSKIENNSNSSQPMRKNISLIINNIYRSVRLNYIYLKLKLLFPRPVHVSMACLGVRWHWPGRCGAAWSLLPGTRPHCSMVPTVVTSGPRIPIVSLIASLGDELLCVNLFFYFHLSPDFQVTANERERKSLQHQIYFNSTSLLSQVQNIM